MESESVTTFPGLDDIFNLKSIKPLNVVMLSIWYPLSISRYFESAFRRFEDVRLTTVGPYTGAQIPWMGGMTLPMKYAKPPNIVLGSPSMGKFPYEIVSASLREEPDLVITIDAGICWNQRPKVSCPVVHVATDPHVLDYSHPRSYSDKFFNMQKCYSQPGDIYLPYAFDPVVHFKDTSIEKDSDAVLVGMPYPQRVELVNRLREHGVSVVFENGPVYDEYREIANSATIGLNWSSRDDMVARVFEIMGMGLVPVINRVPDLKEFFVEDVHYLGFSSLEEAVHKVGWAKTYPEAAASIANNAYRLVWDDWHTYDSRVRQILKDSKVGCE